MGGRGANFVHKTRNAIKRSPQPMVQKSITELIDEVIDAAVAERIKEVTVSKGYEQKYTSISAVEKSIRNLRKRIHEHIGYIRNPKQKYQEWDSFDANRRMKEIRHWTSEIDTFITNIAKDMIVLERMKRKNEGNNNQK